MILDAETLELSNSIERMLEAATPDELTGEVKPELMESVLEIATQPCRTTAEAGEQLRGLRGERVGRGPGLQHAADHGPDEDRAVVLGRSLVHHRDDVLDPLDQALIAQISDRQRLGRSAQRHDRQQLVLVDVERQGMLAGDRSGHELAALVIGLDLEGGGPRRVGQLRSVLSHRYRTSPLSCFSKRLRCGSPNSGRPAAAILRRSRRGSARPRRRRAPATSGRGPTARTGT